MKALSLTLSLIVSSAWTVSIAQASESSRCLDNVVQTLTGQTGDVKVTLEGRTEQDDACQLHVERRGGYLALYLVDRSKIDAETNSVALGGSYQLVYAANNYHYELDRCEVSDEGLEVKSRFIDDEIYSSTQRYLLKAAPLANGKLSVGLYDVGLLPWNRKGFACQF